MIDGTFSWYAWPHKGHLRIALTLLIFELRARLAYATPVSGIHQSEDVARRQRTYKSCQNPRQRLDLVAIHLLLVSEMAVKHSFSIPLSATKIILGEYGQAKLDL